MAPRSAAATPALDSNRHLMNYEHLRQHSLVNLQHSNTKCVYDHKSMLQWQGSSSLGAVDATTMNCLHSLGLLHLATTQQWSLLPALAATRGDRGDATESRSRAAKRKPTPCRTPLPSILLANVHSSENKLDYLKLDLSTIPEMRDCVVSVWDMVKLKCSRWCCWYGRG